jgi:8-oxo-dGTP diphosphatase
LAITFRGFKMGYDNFVLCVDGVYVKNGKILLVKRDVEPFRNYWHLVGGHVEQNESVEDALKREFKEETGLNIEVGDIIDFRTEKTSDRTKIILVLKVKHATGKIKINRENSEYAWFDKKPQKSIYDYAKYLNGEQK